MPREKTWTVIVGDCYYLTDQKTWVSGVFAVLCTWVVKHHYGNILFSTLYAAQKFYHENHEAYAVELLVGGVPWMRWEPSPPLTTKENIYPFNSNNLLGAPTCQAHFKLP